MPNSVINTHHEWYDIELAPKDYDGKQGHLLLCAPELVDLDFNPHGIASGYWQDGEGWLAAKWDLNNDVWMDPRPVTPTHFCIIAAPNYKEEEDEQN